MHRAVIVVLIVTAGLLAVGIGGSAQQDRWMAGAPAAVAPAASAPMPVFTGPYRLRVEVTGPPDTRIVLQRGDVAVPLDLATLGHLDVGQTMDVPLTEAEVKVTANSALGSAPETGPLRCALSAGDISFANDTAGPGKNTVECATAVGA